MNKAITGIISGGTLPTCLSELLQKKSNEDANLREGRRNIEIIAEEHPTSQKLLMSHYS